MEKVQLTPDNKVVALKTISELSGELGSLHEMIKKNELYPDMANVIPSLLEHNIADLCKALGYDSDNDKKIKERYAELRKANDKIRELERKLGEQKDIDIFPEVMKILSEKIKTFWKKEGFGHVSDISFTAYGHCRVKFSGMLFPERGLLIHSETPVSDAKAASQWIQDLKDRGFTLRKESPDSREEQFVLYDDKNVKLLCDMIYKRFPSAKIFNINNYLAHNKKDIYEFRDIEIMVYDLSDI